MSGPQDGSPYSSRLKGGPGRENDPRGGGGEVGEVEKGTICTGEKVQKTLEKDDGLYGRG